MILDPKLYRPPHVSQRVGPPPFDDCLNATLVMGLACWTTGDVVRQDDWSPMTNPQLTDLWERMRNKLPADKQRGPLSLADGRTMTEAVFPYLPPLPFFDAADQLRTWADVVRDLRADFVGLALGNPARCPAGLKLRRWTGSDDYKHWVLLERATTDAIRVYNPLAPYGNYAGEMVPIREVQLFTDTFGTDHVKVGMLLRGEQSQAAIAERKGDARVKAMRDKLDDAAGQVLALKGDLRDAKGRIVGLEARIEELEARPPADCTVETAVARAAALVEAQDAIEALL